MLRLHNLSQMINCDICSPHVTSLHISILTKLLHDTRYVNNTSFNALAVSEDALMQGKETIVLRDEQFHKILRINSRRFTVLNKFITRAHKSIS